MQENIWQKTASFFLAKENFPWETSSMWQGQAFATCLYAHTRRLEAREGLSLSNFF